MTSVENQKKIYLLVPYEKKDEFKELYKIKWDAKTKLWYIGEMVDGLKPYTIMKIQVEYDDKDFLKTKYKSMRWHTADKTWTCSYEDYENFINK
jgi:hypothetical protein